MAVVNQTDIPPVLVTGATGRVGRVVVDQLLDAGVPVRALTHRSEAAATLPAKVDVFTGDLTVPETLDPALNGAGAVFLVWTAPPQTAAAVVERLAAHVRRVVFLSSPHQTPHPFFQQPNPMRCCTPTSSGSSRPPDSSRRSSGRECSRRTRWPGGRPRSGPTRPSVGLTALPRQHPSTTATSQPSRRGRSIRTDTPEATTSLRAPNR
ncbi:SDR family oxidoreductase [Streptomyces agglomeratus]|uniref:SDR family oxidoreductase n=1 Tax=Streptomyces agglomeratus TaxID=285458 RepID=UPI001FD2F4EF|nr:NAD(P)H-binding protein [Streptomyces agglomeratus]